MNVFDELESRIGAGEALGREDAERLLATTDLVRVGMLGELARRSLRGSTVTYGRVCLVSKAMPDEIGDAGEVRLTGVPGSLDEAGGRVRAAVAKAGDVPVTAFSLADLRDLTGRGHVALAELARQLAGEGLAGIAEVPLDRLGSDEEAVGAVRAVTAAGLGAWRATVDRAVAGDRLDLIFLARAIQQTTGAFRAFAPLPRIDPVDQPSTGYDDVRTIAVARLVCRSIPSIQVDWSLYGPKLAQVAIAYGADDLDAVSSIDTISLGPRRSPREDVERQIRATFAVPAERDGRYERRS
jgi:CofH/MqnC C-terminal region